jgi:hypothetical protein
MSGYADETEARATLGKATITPGNMDDYARLTQLNTDLSAEIDLYLHRSLTAAGSVQTPVVWVRDVPYGPLLPVPDFYDLLTVSRGATDVTTDVLTRTTDGTDGPPWHLLVYAPGGVLTSWAEGVAPTAILDGLTVEVRSGWGSTPPRPLVQLATRALVRAWRARQGMYTGGAGDAETTIGTPLELLTDDDKARLSRYVRPQVTAVRAA